MSNRNLIITGYMGTGKSAVGREIAGRLFREFIDTDELIESRTGQSIPEIFARQGESFFRQLEADLCRELSERQGLVVATGGWTLGSPQNRATLEKEGTIVCLRTSIPTLIERVGNEKGRPMLADKDWQSRLRGILASRQPAYFSFPLQVDTTSLSITQVAGRVMHLWQTFADTKLPYALPVMADESSYAVLIGEGLVHQSGALLHGLGNWRTVVQVSDDVVTRLYSQDIRTALSTATPAGNPPFQTIVGCSMPTGEIHKRLDTVADLYNQFLEAGLDRSGLVVALGGGVVGDVVGFAAASYMRGVSLAQMPTTLLAMVDASVGGKTGVDLPAGKNLVGAFKQPEVVIIDPGVLDTLPREDFCAGLAEVVKAGVIGSPVLFEHLERNGTQDIGWIIRQAVKVKIDVVESDPYEHGRRAVLNLGHTFGHAYEVLSDYELRHGDAVAMGTVIAARLAVALGRCNVDVARRITSLLDQLGLPTIPPAFTPEDVWAAMALDKKKRAGRLRFVLPMDIGEVDIFDDVPEEAVLQILEQQSKGGLN